MMTRTKLVTRSLRYYWRTHLGVVLGVAITTAVLVGALAVGDSVRYSLQQMALARLGTVELALASQDRFFRARLAEDLQGKLKTEVAPVLLLRGTAVLNGGEARANHVQVVGVEDRFWKMGGVTHLATKDSSPPLFVNDRLARQLGLRRGDELLLKVEKPSPLPREAPLSTEEDLTASLQGTVAGVAGDSGFGRFSLQANQVPPYNAFVPLSLLQQASGLHDKANLLLMGHSGGHSISPSEADAALRECIQLADVGLELRHVPQPPTLELRSARVFVEPSVATVALEADPAARGVLTYFVNKLQVGARSAPYSVVAAMEAPPVPTDMRDEEIVINEWLAQDLQAHPGQVVTLSYFIVGLMRKLEERTAQFHVRQVVPIEGAAADASLMPEFPGLSGVENCREWKAGVEVDVTRIRDKDEAYWDRYRGAPKAFITLRAGQRLWGNRFGNLTAVRYSATKGSKESLEAKLRSTLNPATIGLYFQPVRAQALAASNQSQDFGQLFLGFSFFLIVSALLLTCLLFVFGVEQRSGEVGVLLALGFTPRRVRALLLQESVLLAILGVALGMSLGVAFTRGVLIGLGSVWRGAVQTSAFLYHAGPATLLLGCVASLLVGQSSLVFVVRKQVRNTPRELLSLGAELIAKTSVSTQRRRGPSFWIAAISGLLALASLPLAASRTEEQGAGIFFGAGALLLIAGLAFCHSLLSRPGCGDTAMDMTLQALAWRNCTRRRGRSLAIVGLLSSACFLIIAVGANRHDSSKGAERRSSGTGGFALLGESSLPVYHDLNDERKKDSLGMEPEEDRSVQFVQLRVHEGEDASCLNLNRVNVPRLLGVNPKELHRRRAFSFTKLADSRFDRQPWLSLNQKGNDGAAPAIGDQATVVWGLGRSIGSVLIYQDERGRDFRVRIVGLLAKSVLQGSLLTSEDNFVQRYPSESGYRLFLIDAPFEKAAKISKTLSSAMEDFGMELTTAAQRLAELNAVENTYLSIFQALGGLGLLLGSVGLGVVVLRNVLERRGEFALLRAVGFSHAVVHRLVFWENMTLMLLGLGCGLLAAIVAVYPAFHSSKAEFPLASLSLTLAAVVGNGSVWIWRATKLSLRGPILDALRNE